MIEPLPPPRYLNLLVGGRCDLRCPCCASWRQTTPETPGKAWARAMREIAAWLPGAAVTISGGEPLLHADIAAITRAAGEAGLAVNLSTSGQPLDDALVEELANWPLNGVTFSLDGFEATHDRWRGAPGLHRRATGWIERLKELRPALRTTAALVIRRDNLDELAAFTDWLLAKPEIDHLYFQAVAAQRGLFPNGVDPRKMPWAPAPERAAKFLVWLAARRETTKKIENSARQLALWRECFRDPAGVWAALGACRVGELALTILADGGVSLCCFEDAFARLGDAPLPELWRSPAADAVRRRMRACRQICNYVINCGCEDLYAEAAP
jgi:MoaA/NifB/PqqE/SkfB family radical SAM enzyme